MSFVTRTRSSRNSQALQSTKVSKIHAAEDVTPEENEEEEEGDGAAYVVALTFSSVPCL